MKTQLVQMNFEKVSFKKLSAIYLNEISVLGNCCVIFQERDALKAVDQKCKKGGRAKRSTKKDGLKKSDSEIRLKKRP